MKNRSMEPELIGDSLSPSGGGRRWVVLGALFLLHLVGVVGGGEWLVVVCAPSGLCSQTDNFLWFIVRYVYWL